VPRSKENSGKYSFFLPSFLFDRSEPLLASADQINVPGRLAQIACDAVEMQLFFAVSQLAYLGPARALRDWPAKLCATQLS
jgi:hypothetical protein